MRKEVKGKRKKWTAVLALAAAASLCSACAVQKRQNVQEQKTAAEEPVQEYDIESVRQYVRELPEEPEALERGGCFVLSYRELFGLENWNSFYENVGTDTADDLVIVQYTMEGDPIFIHLSYDGEKFRYFEDASRDAFGDPENAYREGAFSYLKLLESGAEEDGDIYATLVLTDREGLTYGQVEEALLSSQYRQSDFRLLAGWYQGNINAELSGDEAWHELGTLFDETEALIPAEQIEELEIVNGLTGERLRLNAVDDAEGFEELVGLYEKLDVSPAQSDELREGYAYRLNIYGADGAPLQRVTPYKEALRIDDTMYDASANGTAAQLLIKMREIAGEYAAVHP